METTPSKQELILRSGMDERYPRNNLASIYFASIGDPLQEHRLMPLESSPGPFALVLHGLGMEASEMLLRILGRRRDRPALDDETLLGQALQDSLAHQLWTTNDRLVEHGARLSARRSTHEQADFPTAARYSLNAP